MAVTDDRESLHTSKNNSHDAESEAGTAATTNASEGTARDGTEESGSVVR